MCIVDIEKLVQYLNLYVYAMHNLLKSSNDYSVVNTVPRPLMEGVSRFFKTSLSPLIIGPLTSRDLDFTIVLSPSTIIIEVNYA